MSEFAYAKPAEGRMFVELEKPEEQSSGGIIIPRRTGEFKDEATVVAVGPDYVDSNGRLRTPFARVGDRVWINPNAATDEKRFRDEDGNERTVYVFTFSQINGVILRPEWSLDERA